MANSAYNAVPAPTEMGMIESLSDAITALQKIAADPEYFLAFRGHSDISWQVMPSIFRQSEQVLSNESNIIRELISRYPDQFINDRTMFDKLVRMQHFGLPTRLLDVTSNPLVALFFASETGNGHADHDGSLVIVNVPNVRKKYFDSDSVSCISNIANLSKSEKTSLEETKATTISEFQ